MDTMLLTLLRKRRSIRQFKSKPVEIEKIDVLIESALRSPTSRGRNPWEFIVVTEPRLLSRISQAKEHGSTFLALAPVAIVVTADASKSDVWIEDCSIAAMVIQLAAEDLGLGSCWAQIRLRAHDTSCSAETYLKNLLGLPAFHVVECILGIGYPSEDKIGHSLESLSFDKVHYNKFGG
jgi:nitroreductase